MNKIYSAGQYYVNPAGDVFLLAQVGEKSVSLIVVRDANGDSGNRWVDPVKVGSAYEITQAEFDLIADAAGFPNEFTPVKVQIHY